MTRVALLVFLAALSIQLLGNPNKVDSLKSRLSSSGLDIKDSVDVLNQIGYEYWTVDPRQSLVYGRMALGLSPKVDYPKGKAFSHRVIGVALWAVGDYPLALENMIPALDIYTTIGDSIGMGSMYLNIGLVYADQGNAAEAMANYRRAKSIFLSLNESGRAATTSTKMSTILLEKDSLGAAKDLLHGSVEVHRRNGFNYGLAEAYNRLGVAYSTEGDHRAAFDYLFRARDLSRQINDREGLAKCLGDIGRAKALEGDQTEALRFFGESEALADSIGSKKWKLAALKGMAATHEKLGNTPKALQLFREHQALRESVLSQERIIAIDNLRAEFELREQQRELETAKTNAARFQDESRQKNWLMLLIGVLAFTLLAILLLVQRNNRLKTQSDKLESERVKNQLELEASQQKARLAEERVRNRELETDLELSRRELTSYTVNFIQKNEFLEELKSDLDELKPTREIQNLRQKIIRSKTADKDWEKFRMQFEKVHGSFAAELKAAHPELSANELNHLSLIRLNQNTKECAALLGISPESAKTARYRMRKKLKPEGESPLYDYLLKFGN